MLNGVFQRPYLNNKNNLVKQKQDEEKNASSAAQQEERSNQNAKSKGLQYVENKTYTPAYKPAEQQLDWRQMRSQIQSQVKTKSPQNSVQTEAVSQSTNSLSGRSTVINIAQILKDFNNTAVAIGTPENIKSKVDKYVDIIKEDVSSSNPDVKLIKSNLKNASTILDAYISETLNKDSKVVENWVDALFLQQIDFKYNEEQINPQFLVKFPEGSVNKEEKQESKTAVEQTVQEPVEKEIQTNSKVISLIPQDKELKSLFIQSKKLAYANQPEKALKTFEQALKRADEVGDVETKSKIYFEVGRIYDDFDYYPQALTSYNKSLQNTSDNNVKTKAHYSMAQIYDDVNQITPALEHYYSSIAFAGEAENLSAQSTSLTKMGNIYTDMYDDKSFEFYSVAEDLAEQGENSKIKGFIASSKANAYEQFDEPQKALKSYSNAVKHYSDANSHLKTAQNYTKAADIMVGFSNISKAKGLLSKAQNYARQTDDVNLMNEISDKLKSLELLG